MARKPSGLVGPVRVSVRAGGAQLDHLTINWPADQKGIEWKVLEYLLRDWESNNLPVPAVTDGGTEELDFLLEYPKRKAYMELMEAVVPAEKIPFQPGHAKHEAGPYADKIFAGVKKKIAKYGLRHEVPIDLLIYITHEQYNPNDAALWALARRFADTPHPFEFVYFVVPLADDFARISLLYVKDQPMRFPPSESFEKVTWINLVGSGARLQAAPD